MRREPEFVGGWANSGGAIQFLRLTLTIALLLFSVPLQVGGPLKVAGVSGFNPGTAGTALTWPQGAVQYYTDQGDLSPVRTGAKLPNTRSRSKQ